MAREGGAHLWAKDDSCQFAQAEVTSTNYPDHLAQCDTYSQANNGRGAQMGLQLTLFTYQIKRLHEWNVKFLFRTSILDCSSSETTALMQMPCGTKKGMKEKTLLIKLIGDTSKDRVVLGWMSRPQWATTWPFLVWPIRLMRGQVSFLPSPPRSTWVDCFSQDHFFVRITQVADARFDWWHQRALRLQWRTGVTVYFFVECNE